MYLNEQIGRFILEAPGVSGISFIQICHFQGPNFPEAMHLPHRQASQQTYKQWLLLDFSIRGNTSLNTIQKQNRVNDVSESVFMQVRAAAVKTGLYLTVRFGIPILSRLSCQAPVLWSKAVSDLSKPNTNLRSVILQSICPFQKAVV